MFRRKCGRLRNLASEIARQIPAGGKIPGDAVARQILLGTLLQKPRGIRQDEQFEELRAIGIELDRLPTGGRPLKKIVDAPDQIASECLSGERFSATESRGDMVRAGLCRGSFYDVRFADHPHHGRVQAKGQSNVVPSVLRG